MYLPQFLISAAVKRTRRGKIPAVPGSFRGHVGGSETSLLRRVGPCLPAPFRKTGDNRPGSLTFMAVPLLREKTKITCMIPARGYRRGKQRRVEQKHVAVG